MIFTQETKDKLLLEFLIAYEAWCDTDINPEGFSITTGLCNNIDTFQDNRNMREFAIDCEVDTEDDDYDCDFPDCTSTIWLLWDHLNEYFAKDEDGDPESAPFGTTRYETDDFRENPKRRAWVKMMIIQLLDRQ